MLSMLGACRFQGRQARAPGIGGWEVVESVRPWVNAAFRVCFLFVGRGGQGCRIQELLAAQDGDNIHSMDLPLPLPPLTPHPSIPPPTHTHACPAANPPPTHPPPPTPSPLAAIPPLQTLSSCQTHAPCWLCWKSKTSWVSSQVSGALTFDFAALFDPSAALVLTAGFWQSAAP